MTRTEGALAGLGLALGTTAALVPLFLPAGKAWPDSPAFGASLVAGTLAIAAGVGFEASRRARLRPATSRLSAVGVALLVALPVYLLLVGNRATLSTGDTQALRWLPSRLVVERTLDLAGHPAWAGDPPHYSAVAVGTRLLPMAPPGTGLLVLPHAAAALAASGGVVTPALVERWEKHAAALLVAASAALLFLSARRVVPGVAALGAAGVFALATPAFTTAGQALFPATGEVFALCLALCLLPSSPAASPARAAGSGLAVALAFLCRPTALLAGAGLLVLVALRRKGEARAFAAAAAAGVALSAGGLLALYGHPLGGYGLVNLEPAMWTRDLAGGLAGVLASPSRGLLWFCPFLLVLPAAFFATRSDSALRRLWLVSLAVASTEVLLTGSYAKWWGGHGIGPRILVQVSPFLALLLAPLFTRAASRPPRACGLLLALAAAATQLRTAYLPSPLDWNTVVDVDRRPGILWSLVDSQLAAIWRPGWRPSWIEAADDHGLLGSVDEPKAGATVRGTLVVFGWARAEGDDLSVRILVDGEDRTPPDLERLPRPDVASAFPGLGDASRAGFLARVEMRERDAGSRRVDLVFRSRDGRKRRYPGPAFTWVP